MNESANRSHGHLHQIREEHRGIRQQMKYILKLWEKQPQANGGEWFRELEHLTRDLRQTLETHFKFEEKGGFMKPVLEARPTKSQAVDHLLEEHGRILEQFDRLIASLEAAKIEPARLKDLGEEYKNLIAGVQHHERAENELIQMVFTQDLGAGD